MSGALRALARAAEQTTLAGSRGFQTSSAAQGGQYAWMHEKQFNIPAVKNRTLKFGGGVLGLVVVGFGIPFFAAWWQIKKAAG